MCALTGEWIDVDDVISAVAVLDDEVGAKERYVEVLADAGNHQLDICAIRPNDRMLVLVHLSTRPANSKL